jgi:hypothetical protein
MWEADTAARGVKTHVSPMLRDYLEWPNDHFIPDDPCWLLLFAGVTLGDVEFLLAVEDWAGVELPPDEMPKLDTTYGEFIQWVATHRTCRPSVTG